MSNRNRILDLPELRSSRSSLTSNLLSTKTLRSHVVNFRSSAGSLPENDREQTATRKSLPSLHDSQVSSRSRQNVSRKSPNSLPFSRLSLLNSKADSEPEVTTNLNSSIPNTPKEQPKPPDHVSSADVPAQSSFSVKTNDKGYQKNSVARYPQLERQHSYTYRCLVGLLNLGNTCFMASQLQSLGCLSDIIGYFADNKHIANINMKSPSKGRLVQSFSALMNKLRNGPDGAVARPSEIKDALGNICRRFSGFAQQDSQEFLRTLLSGIHDDINEISKVPFYSEIVENVQDSDDVLSDRWWNNYTDRNRSFISGLFCGQLKNQVICTECSHISRTFDPFWDLSLQIKTGIQTASALDDCFRTFTAEESINDYYCSRCKDHVTAKRKMSIHRFPQILVIHLKRFEFSSVLPRKLNTMIQFPLEGLELSKYASDTARLKIVPVYDLKAVSNHYGNTSGGHYTAMGMISNETWAEFNDSSATKISASSVCSSAAYVLFFKLRSH